MNRWISNIIWWWECRHNPMASLPEWRKAKEAERRGIRSGCTQAVGRARKEQRAIVHAALRGKGA